MGLTCFVLDYYYLIRPTPQLLARLAAWPDPDMLDLFGRSTLLSQKEGGRVSSRDQYLEDAKNRVKLVFLATVVDMLGLERIHNLLEGTASRTPLTCETFDQWWTIERLELEYSVENVIAHTETASFQALAAPADHVLQEWLESVVEEKQSPKTGTP